MMRALCAGLMLALTACGSRGVPAPATPKAAAPAPQPGVRAELPGHGFSAEFPSAPQLQTVGGERPMTQLLVTGAQNYSLLVVSMVGKDRPKDDDWYEGVRNNLKLEKRGNFQVGSFEGAEMGGLFKGRQTIARLLAVGDALLIAQVDAKPGELDVAAAQRFVKSIEVTLPWRIYASPIARFSVMVPAHAVEVDNTAHLKGEGRGTMRGFFVGGRDKLSYWATAHEIAARGERVSDEQVLDLAIGGIREDGSEITFQGPVEAGGLRGREFMAKHNGEVSRGRIWIGDDFIYVLTVGARSEQTLRDAEVSKFYDSLVWY